MSKRKARTRQEEGRGGEPAAGLPPPAQGPLPAVPGARGHGAGESGAEDGRATGGQPVVTEEDRRSFLAQFGTTAAMMGGLACSYGTCGVMAGRYLYPAGRSDLDWQFVLPVAEMQAGQSREFVGPSGAKVVIARQADADVAESFIALSSVCPHLGCQVHWESQNSRFFCPCHNGAFDPEGRPTSGPPHQAGQSLTRFPLKVDAGRLYVLVPMHSVTEVAQA